LLFFICFTSVFAQETKYIQGVVYSSDSLKALPNVHIISKIAHRGTISLPDGSFFLRSAPNDSLLFSSIGFVRKIVTVTEQMILTNNAITVTLERDTVKMEEVVVRSFYDWQTFKYMLVNMKPLKPVNLESMDNELETSLEEIRNYPASFGGPVQAFYDYFNDMARLRRRMEHNRKLYNEQLILEGKIDDTIPALPLHLLQKTE
jgi:hypothetical protein